MSKQQHTPGPWKTDAANATNDGSSTPTVYPEEYTGTGIIADVYDCGYDCNANARLIAAAPELLDALQAVAKYLVSNNREDWWGRKQEKAFDAMKEAIRKATAQ